MKCRKLKCGKGHTLRTRRWHGAKKGHKLKPRERRASHPPHLLLCSIKSENKKLVLWTPLAFSHSRWWGDRLAPWHNNQERWWWTSGWKMIPLLSLYFFCFLSTSTFLCYQFIFSVSWCHFLLCSPSPINCVRFRTYFVSFPYFVSRLHPPVINHWTISPSMPFHEYKYLLYLYILCRVRCQVIPMTWFDSWLARLLAESTHYPYILVPATCLGTIGLLWLVRWQFFLCPNVCRPWLRLLLIHCR